MLAVVYAVLWVLIILELLLEGRGKKATSDGVRSFKASMPPRALAGPLGARFIGTGGLLLRVMRPWSRFRGTLEVSAKLVRFEPNSDERELPRGGGCRRSDVTRCVIGRYSVRRWWVEVGTSEGSFSLLVPGRTDAESVLAAVERSARAHVHSTSSNS